MEVADQWRREWAGTAEYGKVTEGGITRRVARAMEVLHASGPGSRVRVMRAAYHSTAGPGIPAASYMLHSSRRILSSGFNLEEPPSLPNRPLEISSVPLESSPDTHIETENYKVTEPDDIDISEPSKWRGSTRANGIRMPSEESSSTDNASIIDLDSRSSSRNIHRKYSYDSENSDINWNKKSSSRMSPLLDAPVTLSTLKYKSLLNNSSEWNTRRKSYSFEDSSPVNETPFYNETQAMESSTDSGICKSSEIVNDQIDENMNNKYIEKKDNNTRLRDESFQDWLSKNRINSFYKGTKFKSHREHEIVIEDPVENNISLQANGKVSITLPITVEKGYEGQQSKIAQPSDEGQRKVKRVEFCKTELHFAAESGKVNIIATDEKPPPSNDFRKRRSVFLPIQNMSDKPITLFGDKTKEYPELNRSEEIIHSDNGESDENTAATKSILKNKIPKPKPYLLGENMVFGLKDEIQSNDYQKDISVATAVSLINKQLEADKRYSNENTTIYPREIHTQVTNCQTPRTINQGPLRNEESERRDSNNSDVINNIHILKNEPQRSPTQNRLKARQLRESDLTYFGIDNAPNNIISERVIKNKLSTTNIVEDSVFHSVRLIKQISHSVSNSEPESEDSPEYQNLPLNTSYAPIPTPRHRLKYDDQPNEIEEINIIKPTISREESILNGIEKRAFRRTKSREQYETITAMSRSRSEPRKNYNNSLSKSRGQQIQSSRCNRYHEIQNKEIEQKDKKMSIKSTDANNNNKKLIDDSAPLYVNLNSDSGFDDKNDQRQNPETPNDPQKIPCPNNDLRKKKNKPEMNIPSIRHTNKKSPTRSPNRYRIENDKNEIKNIKDSHKREIITQNKKKVNSDKREKVLVSKEINPDKLYIKQSTPENHTASKKLEHRSRSLNRRVGDHENNKNDIKSKDESIRIVSEKDVKRNDSHSKRWISPEKRSTQESVKIKDKKSDTESPVRRLSSAQSKQTEKSVIIKNYNIKSANNSTSKRKEYVINYDDKNGTISSVCKVKPDSHSSRRKKMLVEKPRDSSKENKSNLLQLDHHQEDINILKRANRKWKTKVHVQRSCQLL